MFAVLKAEVVVEMIAIVTFTDPRPTALSKERERALMEKHKALIEALKEFDVLDVNAELKKYEAFEKGENFGIDDKEVTVFHTAQSPG